MPITPIQAPNILGSYIQGLELGRQAKAQRAKEAQTVELQNMLRSATAEQLEDPAFINQLLVRPGGAEFAKPLAESLTARQGMRKGQLEVMRMEVERLAGEAGSFLQAYQENPASLNKAAIAPWLNSAVRRGLMNPEDLQTFEAMPDDPQQLANRLQQLQAQGMSVADQMRYTTPTVEAMLPYTQPKSPQVLAQDIERARAGAARTQVTTTNVQERAEAGKFGETLVADYTAIRDRAESGRRFLSTLDQAQQALDAGLRTGFGADTIRQGAKVLAALGDKNAEKNAANAELFLAAGKENVLRRQIEQKGPQTESDATRIEETFISLGTTPKANQFMLDVARAQIKRDGEQQRFYSKWRRDNGTFDGAEEAWLDGEGGKSLFDRPELKKYAAKNAGSDEPVKVKTVEEARALSPGTRFVTPDGRIKVR